VIQKDIRALPERIRILQVNSCCSKYFQKRWMGTMRQCCLERGEFPNHSGWLAGWDSKAEGAKNERKL
jgi:hypothetical protein